MTAAHNRSSRMTHMDVRAGTPHDPSQYKGLAQVSVLLFIFRADGYWTDHLPGQDGNTMQISFQNVDSRTSTTCTISLSARLHAAS